MNKHFKKPTKAILVFTVIFSWIFSGWPQIWNHPAFPPKIQEARAAVGFIGVSNLIATRGAAPGAITPHASTQNKNSLH